MSIDNLSRRAFLHLAANTARHSLIVLSVPALVAGCKEANEARATAAPFMTLSEAEAAELTAIAARILPSDDTPGATEAGVIYFMDTVLDGDRAALLPPIQQGLLALQTSANSAYGTTSFHSLSADQQDALLHAIDDTPFFDTLRYLTIAGMFALPEYGGNKDKVGWQLIGFEDRHMWQPPFGYYDKDYMEQGA